jgi:hypothetical protein
MADDGNQQRERNYNVFRYADASSWVDQGEVVARTADDALQLFAEEKKAEGEFMVIPSRFVVRRKVKKNVATTFAVMPSDG